MPGQNYTSGGSSNIQLISEGVIRELAQSCGVNYAEAMLLVARANAARDFKGLGELQRVMPQEHNAFGWNKKTLLIGVDAGFDAGLRLAGAAAIYFHFVAEKKEIQGNSHASEWLTLDANAISLGATVGLGILNVIISKVVKPYFNKQLDDNLANKTKFLDILIRLMKGEDSWERNYANTGIARVAIQGPEAAVIPMSGPVVGVSYVRADSLIHLGM